MPRLLSLLLLLAAGSTAHAELKVYPPVVTLTGQDDAAQLLVVEEQAGRVVADHTATATFTLADPKLAKADAAQLTPLADGETTITATVNGQTATAKVVVKGTTQPTAWSFRNHVEPVMTRTGCNSGACHGALAGKGGLKLSLRGYDPEADHFVLTRQALARRIDQTSPENSLLLKKGAKQMSHGGGERLPADGVHYDIVLKWIRAGSPGPSDTDVSLDSIEVFPKAALLKPQAAARLVVVAKYADGSARDVTRWCKFSSSDDLMAGVDEDGKVKVNGHGEASVTANFGTRLTTMTVTSPFATATDDTTFAKSPRSNFIDDHVLAKLKLLRLPPSEQCSDAEFVRRAFLDTCGILPKPEEAAAFLKDTRADRAKLIDALLERPEFVDYWAFKWSDLLLVSSRRLPQPAMWAFYRQVRQSVADNQPWDQFARSILSASGSTLTNGGANYFVIHKDVTDLVESTAVTFLGTSINCCRCHNHPLEKWTQDQYWAMANLFGRVGLKNGDRPGEVSVQSLPTGDALHLRRGTAMPPTPLDGKPLALDSPADRREHLADWLTSPANPYFAKALVNRVWKNFLGRGLVEAEDDLRESNPPSNRELFDAVTKDFVDHKFDVKHLMRTILNSAAYQRSSKPLPANATDDRFYSRYLVRRLNAEVLLDAYSDVTGVPTAFTKLSLGPTGGEKNDASFPAGTRAMQLPDSLLISRFLDAFGRADRLQVCSCERTTDSSVRQALHLNNGQTLNDKLRDSKSRVAVWLKEKATDADVVTRLYQFSLTREPTDAEKTKLVAVLKDAKTDADRRDAVEDLFWAVLTSQEFLFNR
ncbi:DUF1553 domain-containing protein [Limnoglobus roseus]|uniref:S-layer protein n=1 Tax=Limnoglobus roseus TaxID=2598579 RepID=A0A5C1A8K8_9BACT|nr:DUF1553 domain-containing protein [Limnoglobus roseus]QEL15669.1 hypothetical protein PX52LOC_02604 [Limnoglobus roseus]